MLAEGKKLRRHWAEKSNHYPPIHKVLDLMGKSKGKQRCIFEEHLSGASRFLCLPQASPPPVQRGMAVKMVKQMQARSCEALKALWLDCGILKFEDGAEQDELPRFHKDAFEEMWGDFCIVWQAGRCNEDDELYGVAGEPQGIVRCTCWQMSSLQKNGGASTCGAEGLFRIVPSEEQRGTGRWKPLEDGRQESGKHEDLRPV